MDIRERVDLKPFTYFKIGGAARYFAEVATEQELEEALLFAREKKIPFVIIGAASNMLVADRGFSGIAIRMLLRDITRDGSRLMLGAGVPNALAVARAVKEGLLGFEWAIGIPGTIGGSLRGNAGCYSGEMKDVVERVRFYDAEHSEWKEMGNAQCEFGYRESIFKKHPEWIITYVTLLLRSGKSETAQRMVRHYTAERSKSQDIGTSSAGCMFKNVAWPKEEHARERLLFILPQLAEFSRRQTIPASFLIDHLGLKGKTIGGVSISKRHANYIVNHGNGTSEDVVMLVGLVKEYVHRKFNLHLEEEIQYVGF